MSDTLKRALNEASLETRKCKDNYLKAKQKQDCLEKKWVEKICEEGEEKLWKSRMDDIIDIWRTQDCWKFRCFVAGRNNPPDAFNEKEINYYSKTWSEWKKGAIMAGFITGKEEQLRQEREEGEMMMQEDEVFHLEDY